MKFAGDFDVVSQDLEGFEASFKSSLVTKYQSFSLQESQITSFDVYRGSVVVAITLEDSVEGGEETNSDVANITLLIIQLEQDVRDSNV